MSARNLEALFAVAKPGDVGIIGDPLSHSLSPAMHNAAFQTWWGAFRDRDVATPAYHKFELDADHLAEAFRWIRARRLRGVNVTVPFKEAAVRHVDRLDPFAKEVGAINTVVLKDDMLTGFNTDGDGFRRAIEHEMGLDLAGKRALVLGAGGTGRVIAHKLIDMQLQVSMWNRTSARLRALIATAGALSETNAVVTERDIREACGHANLIVNATAVGLSPEDGLPCDGLAFRPGQAVFDVVYHRETRFMQEAAAAGAQVSGGLPMLLYQGAAAFELWVGAPAPKELMWRALSQSMKGQ